MSLLLPHQDFMKCSMERIQQLDEAHRLFCTAEEIRHGASTTRSTCHNNAINYFYHNNQGILRSLLESEITTLVQQCHCRSSDWSKICLLLIFSTTEKKEKPSVRSTIRTATTTTTPMDDRLQLLVSDCCFEGTCILIMQLTVNLCSSTTSSDTTVYDIKTNSSFWKDLPYGIHNCSSISNSILSIDTARVHRCTVIENTLIDECSELTNCGRIGCTQQRLTSLHISVGPESGGERQLNLTPESTMPDIGHQLSTMSHQSDLRNTKQWRRNLTIIGRKCTIRDSSTIDTVYLHEAAIIQAVSLVQQCILFPEATIRNASTVSNAILQWNCAIDNSSVSSTFLMEQASIGPHSIVSESVLGPDTHVSGGEVHASVLGPNTNAHHQSLIISVLWPLGRGNVGYGCNLGSNHTGRIPDQECCAGEGIFWGLSCVIKFPIDLSSAPYSIVAAGTTLSPQRCTMPFSLIVANTNGIGTSILPGWVLRSSPYTIVRSEQKFANRRKAIRHQSYTGWKIIRSENVRHCIMARAALQSVAGAVMYQSDRAIPGIGANCLSEKERLIGINTYTDCIQLFALQGLYFWLLPLIPKGSVLQALKSDLSESCLIQTSVARVSESKIQWPVFPWDVCQSTNAFWKEQRKVLLEEFPLRRNENVADWACHLLQKLLVLERNHADRVYKCKQRDDARGADIIPDYSNVHILADADPVILGVQDELRTKEENVQILLREINQRSKL